MRIALVHPLPGSKPTDSYGWRPAIPSIGLPAQIHNGQDYAANAWTPIRAAHSGTVIWNGVDNIGGNGIQIQHPDGWSTLYFHLIQRAPLAVGTSVVAGVTVIGYVGMTGSATGNHLHFMLRHLGKDVDPVPYIVKAPTEKPIPTPNPKPPAPGQEEDEDMAQYMGAYIGGNAQTPARERACVIYEPTSGFYTTFSGVDQDYINGQAYMYGTRNFRIMTAKHWEQTVLPQLLVQQAKGRTVTAVVDATIKNVAV